MTKQKKLTEEQNKVRKKKREDRDAKAFQVIVDKLKKEKSKEELLKIVSIQPENHELNDFMAARKALDELKIPYSRSFK